MASIAPRIKDSNHGAAGKAHSRTAHLDIEIVAAALIRNDANIRNAARALDVPSGDLRKLVLIDQRLADAALEAVELRLDDAEANLCEALHCGDPRRRDAISMFLLRNTQRAAKRGYAVAASAGSLEVGFDNRAAAQTMVFKWAGDDREMGTIERDGKSISVPRYGDGRGDDCLEGEVATPAVLIEHEPAAAEPVVVEAEPDPAPEPTLPEPDLAAVRYECARVDKWIKDRLLNWPLSSCMCCRRPFVAGDAWEEVASFAEIPARARFHSVCHAEWRSKRETAARGALGLPAA